MKVPVVHADGTITVLLETKGGVYDQVELIRLDDAGNVLSRNPLRSLRRREAPMRRRNRAYSVAAT